LILAAILAIVPFVSKAQNAPINLSCLAHETKFIVDFDYSKGTHKGLDEVSFAEMETE